MTVKEQVLSLIEKIQGLPSDVLVKLLMMMVRQVLAHWVTEVQKHHESMVRYPEGTAMRKSVEAKYNEAFDHWHRVSFLVLKLEEVQKFKGLGGGSKPRVGKTVEPAQQVAA